MVGFQQRRQETGGLEDEREDSQEKSIRGPLMNTFEMEGFMAQKGLWNLAGEKILRERGTLPTEEGDAIREYKAMHEETFLEAAG